MVKKLHFIINPAAGADYPILPVLYRKFKGTGISWGVSVPTSIEETKVHIQTAIRKGTDMIVAYGGDGTITEVAKIMCNKNVPLAILPGGTANVFAKELMLPTSIEENLELITANKRKLRKVDMATANGHNFIIRVNMGVFAEMITEVDKTLKKTIGQLAYSIKAIQKLTEETSTKYFLTIDGKKIETKGHALMVANTGNIGITGYSFFPNTSVSDGKLDVIVLNSKDLTYLTTAAAKTINQSAHPPLQHWKGKHIKVHAEPSQTILLDDGPLKSSKLDIKILPKSLSVLVPA